MNDSRTQRLCEERIGSLLVQYAGPAIAGLVVFGIQTLVGNILVGRYLGTLALAGYTVANSVAMVVLACGLLLGTGSSIHIAMHLGAGRKAAAQDIFSAACFLCVLGGGGLSLLGLLFLRPMLIAFGGAGDVLAAATDFTWVFLLGCCPFLLNMVFGHALRATGYPMKALVANYLSLLLNIGLMLLFVFVFSLGLEGIAGANILSSLVIFLWLTGHFWGRGTVVRILLNGFRQKGQSIRAILKTGFPTFARQILMPVVAILSNHIAMSLGGEAAVAVKGVVVTTYFFLIMPVQGIGMGMQPIVSYNFGAGKIARVLRVVRLGLVGSCAICLVEMLLVLPFRERIAGFFLAGQSGLTASAGLGILLALSVFPIAGVQYIGINAFQSMGRESLALAASISRSLLSAVLIVVLSSFWGMNGLFAGGAVCDLVMAVVIGGLLWVQHRKARSSGPAVCPQRT
ncbi:MAG: MATE family efflux transporter [Desulfovibrio sp.]|uniref:MATE family efflux transporter n=1 Tax=Desulfovibrio sp. 7SRBS1 TaxID=3378064 RepID=UPI003B3BEE91